MPSDDPLIARSRTIPTSTWSDALDRLRLTGVVHGLVWRSGSTPIVGRAVTVRQEVGPLGTYPTADFDVGAMLRTASSGDVLVVDMGGADVSTFGGLAARAAITRSIEGIVIDGGCRDVADIQAVNCKVCSRHVVPTSGKERAHVVEINGSVTCGTVSVRAGDVVIADHTGVVIVPAARFDEVLTIAEELLARDRRFEEALTAGQPFHEIAKHVGYF